MAVTLMRHESEAGSLGSLTREEPCVIGELDSSNQSEVLEFLSARKIHTVFMSSLIHDNGLLSPHNRGSFYSCRDGYGKLEGVALLGHATLIETRSENALSQFARLARNCLNAHLIRGEQETIRNFWKHYVNTLKEPRLISREMLFELREPTAAEGIDELRPATLKDLDKVMAVNASMALQEGGTSPLQNDPGGFRSRTARRIEQGRIWVWMQEERLMFKADLVAETPEVTYLEGVHVHAEERRRGYGLRCLTSLARTLLARTESICLTVNEKNQQAARLYEKAGFKFHSHYETIYLR